MRSAMMVGVLCLRLLSALLCEARLDLLLIPHDAGESNFLRPVLDKLLLFFGGQQQQYNISVLTLGEPATSIFANYSQAVTLADLGVQVQVQDGASDRSQLLNARDLQSVARQLQPRVVVEGMVYQMQAQLGSAFKIAADAGADVRVVGIFDSFALWDPSNFGSEYFVAPAAVDECFLCARQQQAGVTATNTVVQPTVTGSPTLGSWQEVASDEELVAAARESMLRAATAVPVEEQVVVTIAGGYGSPGGTYDDALAVLCETALQSPSGSSSSASSSSSYISFFFSPHPGYPPSYESAFFEEHGCGADITIIAESMQLSTALVFAASNATLSQCSTTGGQSLAIAVPHVYVAGAADADSQCSDVFADAGLIPTVSSASELLAALGVLGRSVPPYSVHKGALPEAGVPLDGEEEAVRRLFTLLQ